MRTQKISFPDQPALCVFPQDRSELAQAITELHLNGSHPVIVLIGGEIEEEHTAVTNHAIHTISKVAEEMGALVVCGGTDMGVMAEIGQARWREHYKFPLVGVAPEELVSWPGGPSGTKFLWWGKKRWPLADHYSRFILVPGSQFGDESPWIVEAAGMLSTSHRSVTILINGGEISRKDIELSLAKGRPVIALNGTGRLADELANQSDQHKLLTIVPAIVEQTIVGEIKAALTGSESNVGSSFEVEN